MNALTLPFVEKAATISACGRYRTRLTRRWADGPLLPFVMLNPSTADADIDDATIRCCMGFARREKAAGIVVGNLFSLVATDPDELRNSAHPVGPLNAAALEQIAEEASRDDMPIVCAWGSWRRNFIADARNRALSIFDVRPSRLACLSLTVTGAPRHPLYVPSRQQMESFR